MHTAINLKRRDGRTRFARQITDKRHRHFLSGTQIADLVRELHPAGLSDAEITAVAVDRFKVAVNRHRVGAIRRRLGLASNARSAHVRSNVAIKTKEQLQKAGLATLAELRCERFGQFKRDLGWPETLTVRAVQALEMFWRYGAMSRIQLCDRMGVPNKKRTYPTSNAPGGTVLAELQRAGLIMALKKQLPHQRADGRTTKVDIYFLCPGVKPSDSRQAKFDGDRQDQSGA